MKASVYSVYMENVSSEVIEAQKKVVSGFLPEGWTFEQHLYASPDTDSTALQQCLEKNKNPVIIFLDIDCIPITPEALLSLAEKAFNDNALTGCVQRANHIDNNKHIYAGPFCMAFKVDKYKELGSPSFLESPRGDRGEEITYAWEASGLPISLLWPSYVELPMWNLTNGIMFGLGTYYEGQFYHSFGIRQSNMKSQFISKCNEILKSIPEKKEPVKEVVTPPVVPPSKEVKPRASSTKKVQSIRREEVKVI